MHEFRNATGRSSKSRYRRGVTLLAGVAMLGTLAACGADRLTAPAPTPQAPKAGLLGTVVGIVNNLLTPVTGLLRTVAAPEIRRSITVGQNGGVLEIPETGLRLTIPRGAVSSTTTITVRSIAGKMVAYDFEPHGIKFAVPLQLSQDLSKTAFGSTTSLKGGYFKSTDQLLPGEGLALIDEELPARVSNNRVIIDLWHFSGYLMSTGRASKEQAASFDD